jgi:NTP pyrophosphatase (non-canonical NTP hydrolase)
MNNLDLEIQANSPYNDGWTQQFYREQLEKKTMTKQVDFERYQKFVDAVTSDASTDFVALSDRLVELDEKGANIERLLTAGVGINAEGGEFLEIVKKMIFQGKPFNEDNREHMIIELGDLMWYAAQACMALEVSFDDVIARNVKKLEKRYPGGSFDVYYSENRAEGDL